MNFGLSRVSNIIDTYLLLGETECLDPDSLAAEVSLASLDWVCSSPFLYFSMDCFIFGVEEPLSESCWKESLPRGWDGFFSGTQHSLIILLLDSCLDILPLEDDLSMTPLCMEQDLRKSLSNITLVGHSSPWLLSSQLRLWILSVHLASWLLSFQISITDCTHPEKKF